MQDTLFVLQKIYFTPQQELSCQNSLYQITILSEPDDFKLTRMALYCPKGPQMNRYSAAKRFGISEEDIINIDGKIIHEQMNKHRVNNMFGTNVVTTETLTRKIANIAIKRHNLKEIDAMALARDRMNSVRNTKRINKAILFIIICAIIFWIQS